MARISLRGQPLVLTVSMLTSLGFMLIGYDNGLMGGLVNTPAFNDTFRNPDTAMVGLIVAIFEIGCLLGSVYAAIWGEALGRRRTIMDGCVAMIVGALLQAAAYSRTQLILGRVVSGIGLGIINSTVPVLQAEFSPKASRGVYVCAQLSTLNFGICVVYWIDYAFSSHNGSYAWRTPVIMQCLPIAAIVAILGVIPETPRWLAAHGREDDCLEVLARIKDVPTDDADVRQMHASITHTVEYEAAIGSGTWKALLKDDSISSRRRLLLACAIQSFQQLGGINAIIYYASTLFERSIGFSKNMSALMSGFLQTWFFVASFIPWFLIDRVGRKPLFLYMISVMAAVMAVQAALIYQVENRTASAAGAGVAAAAMLFVFQGAFTIGFQATVWVYPSEVLPLRLRQRGSSLSTAANWMWNYFVVQLTPISIENIGWKTYIIFAILNSIWVPLIYLFFPETKGLELEDVDRLFAKGDALRALGNKPSTPTIAGDAESQESRD
ncbi:hypothetical protein VUR80DRAFT_4146 [Thermomyces stellatus]